MEVQGVFETQRSPLSTLGSSGRKWSQRRSIDQAPVVLVRLHDHQTCEFAPRGNPVPRAFKTQSRTGPRLV